MSPTKTCVHGLAVRPPNLNPNERLIGPYGSRGLILCLVLLVLSYYMSYPMIGPETARQYFNYSIHGDDLDFIWCAWFGLTN